VNIEVGSWGGGCDLVVGDGLAGRRGDRGATEGRRQGRHIEEFRVGS
jgi:hypothetical protein